jgi:hypothetical protein
MSKKFILTEEEKIQIKGLYNINEQDDDDFLIKAFEKFMTPSTGSTENSKGDSYLDDTSTGSVDSKWINVTKKVIDNFEGGYWNPKCGHQTKGMGKSTETMFGLDRYNGNIESTPEGKEFFRLIDKEKNDLGMQQFCNTWKWNYKGGQLEDTLKTLAAKIMKHQYDTNSQNYFSPELKKRVEANDRLLMHFSYASWNGPGFFKKFAKSLEDGVKSGKSDSELINQAIADRKNTSLVNQDKVASVMTSTNLNLA